MPSGTKVVPRNADLAVAVILNAEKDRQGMTQEHLARTVGISQPQVSQVLRGLKPMTMTEMFTMCKALGLIASAVVEQAERETRTR